MTNKGISQFFLMADWRILQYLWDISLDWQTSFAIFSRDQSENFVIYFPWLIKVFSVIFLARDWRISRFFLTIDWRILCFLSCDRLTNIAIFSFYWLANCVSFFLSADWLFRCFILQTIGKNDYFFLELINEFHIFFCNWLTNFVIFSFYWLANCAGFSCNQLANFAVFPCYRFAKIMIFFFCDWSMNFAFFAATDWRVVWFFSMIDCLIS